MSLKPANFRDCVFTITDDAAHSASLQLSDGNIKISNVRPNGVETEVHESQGAVVGHRKGKRALYTITVSGILHTASNDFHDLAMGVTSGFVSTTADIGDAPAVDFDCSFDLGLESRDFVGDDAELTGWDIEFGSPAKVNFTFQCLGKLVADGVTYIAGR